MKRLSKRLFKSDIKVDVNVDKGDTSNSSNTSSTTSNDNLESSSIMEDSDLENKTSDELSSVISQDDSENTSTEIDEETESSTESEDEEQEETTKELDTSVEYLNTICEAKNTITAFENSIKEYGINDQISKLLVDFKVLDIIQTTGNNKLVGLESYELVNNNERLLTSLTEANKYLETSMEGLVGSIFSSIGLFLRNRAFWFKKTFKGWDGKLKEISKIPDIEIEPRLSEVLPVKYALILKGNYTFMTTSIEVLSEYMQNILELAESIKKETYQDSISPDRLIDDINIFIKRNTSTYNNLLNEGFSEKRDILDSFNEFMKLYYNLGNTYIKIEQLFTKIVTNLTLVKSGDGSEIPVPKLKTISEIPQIFITLLSREEEIFKIMDNTLQVIYIQLCSPR